MEELIEYFAGMRLGIATLVPDNRAEATNQLHALNRNFVEMYDKWTDLPAVAQLNSLNEYVDAQTDFLFVADRLIDRIYKGIAQGEMVVLPPIASTQHQEDASQQVQFGDTENNDETMNEDAFSANANELVTLSASEPNKSSLCMDKSNEQMDTNETNLNTVQASRIDTADTNNADKSAKTVENNTTATVVKPARQTNKVELAEESNSDETTYDVSTLTFKQHSGLFERVIKLKMIVKINERSIDTIIKAVQAVVAQTEAHHIRMNQAVIRTIIMHIVATFDEITEVAWDMYIGNFEPSFDAIIAFLLKRKASKDVVAAASAVPTAEKPFKIPKVDNTKQPPNATPKPQGSGTHTARNAKKGGAARSKTPSPAPGSQNMYKRPRPSNESICFKCRGNHLLRDCQAFRAMSCEDREVLAARCHLCINCFSNMHKVNMCLDKACKVCGKKHNSLLHHRPGC